MRVDTNCVGCGQCSAFCPHDAITVFGRAKMGVKCMECGTCMYYCPVSAISEDK